jgi:hypothetical protein
MNIKMKNIILIICIFLPMWAFSQKINTDTSLICIPYKVAKKIALDLNKLDSLTEIDKLTKIEIFEIGKKVTIQENIINLFEQKEKNYELQIKKENEKFVIVDTQNNNLRKEVKKLKTKSLFIKIIGGSIISALTVLTIIK